jgi:hypothetical protein
MSSFDGYDLAGRNITLIAEGVNDVAGFVEELGRFAAASQYIVGVTVRSDAESDSTAFAGGHTTAYREDYGTVAVSLDTPEGIRHATQLFISDERLAEIADVYVLPEHLKNPDNHVDAFIGFIIKKLVGYEENTDISLAEQAAASNHTLLTLPDTTEAQAWAYMTAGRVNMTEAHWNALHRAQQLETAEHVLRFLIAREQAKPSTKGSFRAGLDYDWGTDLLGEMLVIVNGGNGFNNVVDPDENNLLYKGLLPPKSSLRAEDGVVYFSGIQGPKPIWPPAKVAEYEAEKVAQREAGIARQEARQVQKAAEEAARAEAFARQQAGLHQTIADLAEQGYEWHGIMPTTGSALNSSEKVREFVAEKYGVPPQDIYIVPDAAIYGGETPHVMPGTATIYIRKIQNLKPSSE